MTESPVQWGQFVLAQFVVNLPATIICYGVLRWIVPDRPLVYSVISAVIYAGLGILCAYVWGIKIQRLCGIDVDERTR